MAGHEGAVVTALTDPDMVMHDAGHGDRECFYRRGALPEPYGHLYLKVVVEFAAEPVGGAVRGVVITAYPTGDVKSKERSKWQR